MRPSLIPPEASLFLPTWRVMMDEGQRPSSPEHVHTLPPRILMLTMTVGRAINKRTSMCTRPACKNSVLQVV